MLAGEVEHRPGRLEAQLVLGVVDHVLADPLLAATAQVDDRRAPDEVGGDRLLEALELVRVDDDRQVRDQRVRAHGLREYRAVSELTDFGLVVLVVSGAFLAALAAHKLTEFFPVPPPALFLVAAAVASDIWPGLSELSTVDVERIAVVALIVILFDGGMQVGWPRFRESRRADQRAGRGRHVRDRRRDGGLRPHAVRLRLDDGGDPRSGGRADRSRR